MMLKSTKSIGLVLLAAGLLAGAGLAYWLGSTREPPERVAQQEIVRAARVVEVPMVEVWPVAKGYGVARPGSTWQAVARVAGTIVYRHPELQDGSILAAGTRLLGCKNTRMITSHLDQVVALAVESELSARGSFGSNGGRCA